MEIIYLSDVHDAFDRLKDLLNKTEADCYIIAGDLIDRPFFTEEAAAAYRRRQGAFSRIRRRLGYRNLTLDELVSTLEIRTDITDVERARVLSFREETIRARRVMQQKYKILESILRLKDKARILCLPGNYDMDLQYTSLHERDLHRHWHQLGAIRMAGYGGADVFTPGVPEEYTVKYRADRGAAGEMLRFFGEAKPDVVATHKPPHGILDYLIPTGESGSFDLRRYCEENRVLMCLTGHLHDQWGCEEVEGTIYLNPSNFGAINTPAGGMAEGGFFYAITIKDRCIERIFLKKIAHGEIHEIVLYKPEEGLWSKIINDGDRYGHHLMGRPFDGDTKVGWGDVRGRLHAHMSYLFHPVPEMHVPREIVRWVEDSAVALEKRFGVTLGVEIMGCEDRFNEPTWDVVVYLRGREEVVAPITANPSLVTERMADGWRVNVADVLDLNRVIRSMEARDYECDTLLRFVAYRCVGHLIRRGDATRIDERLHEKGYFRGEIEGTGGAYLEIFLNTAAVVNSLTAFDTRLAELGIVAPEAFRKKMERLINGHRKEKR